MKLSNHFIYPLKNPRFSSSPPNHPPPPKP
ncbi:hypothetical protein NC651_038611 [Populus alba x Populus x berolinensis]|nr:hypothetical protein NC651_038611 [Populus alba x Populus x berolinensis]